jgi:hypothetical protein
MWTSVLEVMDTMALVKEQDAVWMPERFVSPLELLRKTPTPQLFINVHTLEGLAQSGKLAFDTQDVLEFWKAELAFREVAAKVAKDRAAFEMNRKLNLS